MKINRLISKNFPSYHASNGAYMGVNTPKRITFHNTAGGTSAKSYAQSEQTEGGWSAGIPHYYVDKDEIWQVLEDRTVSWANGTYAANDGAITIEIVDGYKNVEDFKKAERRAIDLAKSLVKKYNIKVTDSNFRLHREYVSTACPKRSADLHGGTKNTRRYFMNEIKKVNNKPKTEWAVWETRDKNGLVSYIYSEKYENGKLIRNQLDKAKFLTEDVYGYTQLSVKATTNRYKEKGLYHRHQKNGKDMQYKKGDKILAKFVGKVIR